MDPVMAYPFSGYGVVGVFEAKPVQSVYETAVRNILLTPKGSVPWDPTYGSVLHTFVFELNDIINQNLILFYANRDIAQQEPRLRLVGLDATFDVDNYTVSFSVAFIAYDDPTETVQVAKITNVDLNPMNRVA